VKNRSFLIWAAVRLLNSSVLLSHELWGADVVPWITLQRRAHFESVSCSDRKPVGHTGSQARLRKGASQVREQRVAEVAMKIFLEAPKITAAAHICAIGALPTLDCRLPS